MGRQLQFSYSQTVREGHHCCCWGGLEDPGTIEAHQGWLTLEAAVEGIGEKNHQTIHNHLINTVYCLLSLLYTRDLYA